MRRKTLIAFIFAVVAAATLTVSPARASNVARAPNCLRRRLRFSGKRCSVDAALSGVAYDASSRVQTASKQVQTKPNKAK
jgi:hypothetical protein